MRLSPRAQLAALGVTLEQMEAEAPEEPVLRFTDVQRGPELHRILTAPRRPIPNPDHPESLELAAFLTERLATRPDPYPGALRPVQALALKEAWECRGLFAPIKVGGGKMLLTYLLPVVLGAKRPLLLTMAQMIPDTVKQFALYRQSWHGPSAADYPMLSYEKLSSPTSGEDVDADGKVVRLSRLELLAPDLIIMDEAHCLKDSGTPRNKRVRAYLRKFPDTIVIAMTGTPFVSSIKDAAHILEWCLGERCPLPTDFLEREAWASYLDAKQGMGPRAGIGALRDFLTEAEQNEYDVLGGGEDGRSVVRRAISRRILETPGVIGTQDPPLDVPLTVDALYPEAEDPAIEQAIYELRKTWRLPDGTELSDPMQMSRHCTTLGRGLWQKWDPAPPDEWREARNAWSKWCRKAIKANRKGIDSEARMKAAVKKGVFNDDGLLAAWEAADAAERARTGLREPPSVAQWVSDEIVGVVREWVQEYGGLVWTDSIGLGIRLSDALGIPYYGAESRDRHRRHILDHPGGPAVASLASCGTGKNLQSFWSDNLWLCPPGEQSVARTHRPGQRAAVVRNWVYLGCADHLKAYYAAKACKAKFTEEMQSSPQKLRYAQTDMPTMRELEQRGGARWSMRRPDDEDE